jgi:uncharacterized membrane protein YhaH (DUF805 family)
MTALGAIFSVHGRVNRARYWLFLVVEIVLFAILLGAFFAYALSIPGAYENGGPTPFPADPLGIAGAMIWYVLMFAVWAAALTMAIKRLHDRDKPWGWAVLFVFGPFALFALGQYLTGTHWAGSVSYLVHVAAVLLLLWAFVELCFLRGTAGENPYGPDAATR